jgi:nicotinamidase-related amidase
MKPALLRGVGRIARLVIDHTLPPSQWTHEAHLALCLHLLVNDAADELPDIIRGYNDAIGKPNDDHRGFHATVTEFYVRALRTFLGTRPADEHLDDTLAVLLTRRESTRDYPLLFYSRDRLFSIAARRGFIEPDLRPLQGPDAPAASSAVIVEVPGGTGMRTAMLVIDLQCGSVCDSNPKHDSDGLVRRLNGLARRVRRGDGIVIFVQQDGPKGDDHYPGTPGWELLPDLDVREEDIVIRKTCCDAFLGTELTEILDAHGAENLIITGCSTDFCVDTTVRSALGRGYRTFVPVDGHTTSDRPHLPAESIIAHHDSIWRNFIGPNGPAVTIACLELPV